LQSASHITKQTQMFQNNTNRKKVFSFLGFLIGGVCKTLQKSVQNVPKVASQSINLLGTLGNKGL